MAALGRLLVAMALLAPTAARASAPELFGPGTRSPALGGTGVSYADDYEAVYENPAGLAEARTRRLVVGVVAARYSLRLDGASHPVDDTNGLFIGAQLPIPFGGALANRVVLGLHVYFPVGVVNRADNPFPDTPALPVLDNRTQTVSVMLAGAVRVLPRLSVGAGALALAALTGAVDLGTDGAGRFVAQSNEQLVASYAPLAGVQVDAGHRVRVGLAFRGESLSRYDITVRSDLTSVLKVFNLPTLRLAGVSQYDPMQLALEASWRPAPPWLLAVGLTWAHWSAFPPPAEWVTASPPEGAPRLPVPGFHDTVLPRVGAEWSEAHGALRTTFRAGYFFAPSPAPASGPDRLLLDAHRHVATLGLELLVENRLAPIRLAGFCQWHQLQSNERVGGSFFVLGLHLGTDL